MLFTAKLAGFLPRLAEVIFEPGAERASIRRFNGREGPDHDVTMCTGDLKGW